MFLRFRNLFSSKIGIRIATVYVTVFVVSAASFFLALYLLLAHTFERHDREVVGLRLQQLVLIYNKDGIKGLEASVTDRVKWPDGGRLFLRLQSADGRVPYIHLPDHNMDFTPLEIKQKTDGPFPAPTFMKLTSANDSEDVLEIVSQPTADGSVLQVGKDTDDREENLDRFRTTFSLILIPWLIVGLGVGVYFSNRSLRPIRRFLKTIRSIQGGDTQARVPTTGNRDELDQLALAFNAMLSKNEKLIEGMRDSLDAISHDLKTPMTRVLGLSERGLKSEGAADKNEALTEVMDSSQEIIAILDNILDVLEAESGAIKLNIETMTDANLLGEVLDLYELVAEDRHIKIEIKPSHIKFEADARLKQALANLVDNAIKYSPENSQIVMSSRGEQSKLVIEVQDQGRGMAEAEISRIWARLYRGDASRSTKGAGLGLSIVRSIVHAHGGEVGVESVVGSGSVFRMTIPIEQATGIDV